MKEIDFERVKNDCVEWIRNWFEENGKGCNAVIGLSGGKDSTIVAALCVEALGKEKVIGVAMPDSLQGLNEADKIAEYLGIHFLNIPIGRITNEFHNFNPIINLSEQAIQNIPPRVRMSMLYAVAQSMFGRVACTCNLSEDYIGYSTLFGDSVGSFAPLSNLTVTEVIALGHELGLPSEWVDKAPDDGLPNSSPDEVKFGFTYATLDKYIRTGKCEDEQVKAKINERHDKNTFKSLIIRIPSYLPYFMRMSYVDQVLLYENNFQNK